jgi:hypothetical protein
MKRSLVHRCVAIAFAAVFLLFAGGFSAFAQRTNNTAPKKELPLQELLRLPGKLISEGKTIRPTAELKLTGYRVEEIQLTRNLTVELHGQQAVVAKAWRVSVQGGPFPVRALPAVIWIDDQIVGIGIENETLSQVTAITFDESLIHEGGVVSISYGENTEGRVRIAPRLQLKREGENQ